MPNSPEAPGPTRSTVCKWGHIDPDALRLARQLDPSHLVAPCDDPAVVLVYALDAPHGRELCATHARDVVDAALSIATTPRLAAPTLTITALPIPWDDVDAPIPFALVDADELVDELAQLRQAQA